MVSTTGGITEVSAPTTSTVNASRADAQPQSSQSSFGDTLKSQMGGTDGSHGNATQKASNDHASNANSDAQHTDNKNKKQSGKGAGKPGDSTKSGSGQGTKETSGKKKDGGNASSADATPQNAAVVALPAAATAVATTSAADGTGGSPRGKSGIVDVGGGKNLPPTTASPGTNTAADGGVDSLTAADLPNLLQSLGANPGAANKVASERLDNQPDAVGGGGNAGAGDSSLLKELQALASGGAGKDGKNGSGATGQNADSDALLKLIGDAAAKGASELSQPLTVNSGAVGASSAMSPAPAPASASVAAPTQLAVAVPVNQSGWDQAVAERVVWLAQQGIQRASIQLHPKHMGPIEIQIALHKDDASVAFVAHHAVTQEAIQSAMPKLREMMQQSGLNLAQADVSHHSFNQQHQTGGQGQPSGRGSTVPGPALDGMGPLASGEIALHGGMALGAVDYYA